MQLEKSAEQVLPGREGGGGRGNRERERREK
jgi:hypothetical protein